MPQYPIMMSSAHPKEAGCPVVHRIEGPLTIYTVAEEHRRLLGLFPSGAPLRLDLDSLTECDGAGLQLLCSLQRSADKAARPLAWGRLPACVLQSARLAGLPDTFFRDAPATGQ